MTHDTPTKIVYKVVSNLVPHQMRFYVFETYDDFESWLRGAVNLDLDPKWEITNCTNDIVISRMHVTQDQLDRYLAEFRGTND